MIDKNQFTRFIRLNLFTTMMAVFYMTGYCQTVNRSKKNIDPLVDEYYYKAIELINTNETDKAWQLLKYCSLLEDDNAPVNFALSQIFQLYGDDINSFSYIKKAYDSSPNNEEYALTYAYALMNNGNTSRAKEILQLLIKSHPDNETYLERLSLYYLRSGDIKEAIQVYSNLQKISENVPSEFERFTLAKIRIYESVNDFESIENELKVLTKKYPDNTNYLYALLELLLKDEEKHNELSTLLNSLSKEKSKKEVVLFYSTLLALKKNDIQKSFNLVNQFVSIPTVSEHEKLDILQTFNGYLKDDSTKITQMTIPIINKIYQEYPRSSKALLFYASTLKNLGKVEKAFAMSMKAIDIDPTDETLYDNTTNLFLDKNNFKYCADISKRAIDNGIRKVEYYIWSCIPLSDSGKEKEAIEILKTATDDKTLTSTGRSLVLGFMGDLYTSIKDTTNAVICYEKSLSEDPDNPTVANNYAYMILDMHNGDLDKAERLAATAVRLKSEDSNNLDTYAWVFFKKQHYTLAKLYIKRAIDNITEDNEPSTIYFHAGCIYQAISEWEDAKKYYDKAKESYLKNKTGDSKKQIDTINNKIKEVEKQIFLNKKN